MKPSKTAPIEPALIDAVSTLDRLRREGNEARAELASLEGKVEAAACRLGVAAEVASDTLKEVNERLVLSNIKAQENVEICAERLGEVTRYAGLDVLTGLPNRDVLLDRFAHAIAVARRDGSQVGLLFLDLDGFKNVNDEFGHAVGDEVLKQVAACMVGAVREVDTVSRHGGDEFLILLTDMPEAAEAGRVAGKVLAALHSADATGDFCPAPSASIGISIYPLDGDSPGELIALADAAMYNAKRLGPGKIVFHDHQLGAGATAHRDIPARRPGKVHSDLLEANGALVRAAIGAQDLQVAAELALRRQKEYLATVAHELRNPLAPLSVAVSLLRGADPACQAEMQGIIERQVNHMSRLAGDLLDLSRGDSGKLRIYAREIDLREGVEDAVRAMRPGMEARSQVFSLDVPDAAVPMVADPVRVVQILCNLLDNASKYTPRGGDIAMTVQVRGGEAVIEVADSGIGISPGALSAVFEPFAQESHATGFCGTGLGIGLTVVRELVQLHGGRVVASSEGTGRGSRFTVTMPLAGQAGAPRVG